MLLHVIQDATVWLNHLSVVSDAWQSFQIDLSTDHLVLAQQFKQTDLWGDVTRAFDNFVKTGQAWAFVGGLFLGYLLKAFTTFG